MMRETRVGTMKNHYLTVWLLGGWLATMLPLAAQDSLCAMVKIEILQELTLERQAFDARMKITNDTTLPLNDVDIVVNFADADGEPVSASSDPNNTSARFFIRVDSMQGIADVAGNGTVPGEAAAEIHWLIIPAPGAAGAASAGTLYYVGATLRYTLGGEAQETAVAPDQILVKPMPLLTLDYFLPDQVYGDDPFTPEIEPELPFSLGVRVSNNGHGPANNLKIESGQPTIVENELGLLINFRIHGSRVGNRPAGESLLVDFGSIAPYRYGTARWIMTASLSGRFVAFDATFSHADELGGQLTSLMEAVNTHFLVADVRVDLPGRDDIDDFLARTGDTLKVFESDGIDSPVTDVSDAATLITTRAGSQAMTLILPATPTAFVYAKKPDPTQGALVAAGALRDDGKRLPASNVWLSKTWDNPARRWNHFVNIFDFHPQSGDGSRANGAYSYTLTFDPESRQNRPPVLGYTGPRYVQAGHHLGFIVIASDPDGTVPTLSVDGLPAGATFTDFGTGTGEFSWFTAANQTGAYQVVLTASDGELSRSEAVTITVSGDPVYSTVAGRAWNDLNFNGIQDDGEPGIEGIVVRLLKANGNEKTTTTAADGSYEFGEIFDSQVTVEFTAPNATWRFSPTKVGADNNLDSDVLTAYGRSGLISFDGAISVQVDAGMTCISNLRTLRTLVSGAGSINILTPPYRADTDSLLFPADADIVITAVAEDAHRFNAWFEETTPDGPVTPLLPAADSILNMTIALDRTIVADFVPTAPAPTILAVYPEADTMVSGSRELRVTIAEAPTALRHVPAAPPFAQPDGPTHDLLVGEAPVSIGEFLDFLNDTLGRTPDTREAPIFVDVTTGRAYFNAAKTSATLLFEPMPPGLDNAVDWSIEFMPAANALPDHYSCTPGSRDYPVVGVTWFGAIKYANWLTRRKRLGWVHWAYREGTDAADWRPAHLTEAQWLSGFDSEARTAWLERYPDAFRLLMDADSTDADRFNEWYKIAAWNPDTKTNNDNGTAMINTTILSSRDAATAPASISSATANAFGLRHMFDNVRTWLTDSGTDNTERAIRGSSWLDAPGTSNARTRISAMPATAFADVGLRIAAGRDYSVRMQLATNAEFTLPQQLDTQTARAWQPEPGMAPQSQYWWRFRAEYPNTLLPSSADGIWTGTAATTPNMPTTALHFSTDTTTRFSLSLMPGWNLLATPLVAQETTVSPHIIAYLKLWGWNTTLQVYETLSTLTPQRGTWIYTPVPGQIIITGILPPSSEVTINPQWNLIGIKQLEPMIGVDTQGSMQIFSWLAATTDEDGHYAAEHHKVPIILQPGLGYWIWTTNPLPERVLQTIEP